MSPEEFVRVNTTIVMYKARGSGYSRNQEISPIRQKHLISFMDPSVELSTVSMLGAKLNKGKSR